MINNLVRKWFHLNFYFELHIQLVLYKKYFSDDTPIVCVIITGIEQNLFVHDKLSKLASA